MFFYYGLSWNDTKQIKIKRNDIFILTRITDLNSRIYYNENE